MSYWKDRMNKAQDNLTKVHKEEIEKQLTKYYLRAEKQVIKDFEDTYNKILTDALNEQRTALTPADLYKLDKYWQMQGQLKQELQKLGDKQISILSKQFEAEFFDIYKHISLPSLPRYTAISKEAVSQLINQIWAADGKAWSQRIWENMELLADTLNEELLHCAATGKSTSDLKRILQNRFNVSYGRADTLARTELAHIQTQAAKQRYLDAGVQRVQIWADKDERRCDKCGKMHEKIYNINEHIPVPVHPKCRCTIVPVIED